MTFSPNLGTLLHEGVLKARIDYLLDLPIKEEREGLKKNMTFEEQKCSNFVQTRAY